MDIKIRNFNCIEDIELQLHPGFTILQGPSNSGKSSIIKAIENTIFNQSGTTNIRQGQDNYVVGIKKGDQTVSLIKGKNSKYKINGQVYEKFGVSQLPEVADALNIRETILGGEKVRLNFSRQMSYPFLLDKTPGQMYRFIVDSSESESLSNVLKDMSKDIKDAEKSIVQNDAQLDVLVKQQTDLNYKLLHADTILDISSKILELDATDVKISKMVELEESYMKTSQNVADLLSLYNSLNIDVNADSLDIARENYIKYYQEAANYKTILNARDVLQEKANLLDVSINIDGLTRIVEDITSLNTLASLYKENVSQSEVLRNNIARIDENIVGENSKLAEFKVCPLCGSDIKC